MLRFRRAAGLVDLEADLIPLGICIENLVVQERRGVLLEIDGRTGLLDDLVAGSRLGRQRELEARLVVAYGLGIDAKPGTGRRLGRDAEALDGGGGVVGNCEDDPPKERRHNSPLVRTWRPTVGRIGCDGSDL